jgi:hypothetical protein
LTYAEESHRTFRGFAPPSGLKKTKSEHLILRKDTIARGQRRHYTRNRERIPNPRPVYKSFHMDKQQMSTRHNIKQQVPPATLENTALSNG